MDKTEVAVGVFNKLAGLYQEKFMNVDLYTDTFDLFCSSVTKANATVLELACGPGNITKYLLKKRPDFNILGTDLAPNMIKLAQMNNPEAVFRLMDCRDIGLMDEKYDGIMCGFGLPYLSKEEALKLVSDASRLLNHNGVLYLSTMEDDYGKSGLKKGSTGDEIFMHFHQADYLTGAIEENGLHIISIARKEYPAADGTTTTDLVMIAGK